ncbi:MAG: hypothetical protein WD851_17685 [Pirellulales bacterium]
MAARNDQTTQIAVIVLSIVTVLLLGFTYWFYKSSSDANQRIVDLERQGGEEKKAVRSTQLENETYRTFIGLGQSDNMETAQKQYDEDMKRWGNNFGESDRAYRKILERVFDDTIKLANQEADSIEREKQLKAHVTQLEAEKDAQIKTFEAELEKTKQDAAAERTAFNAARDDLEKKQGELATTLAEQRTAFEKQLSDNNAKVAEAQKQLENVERSRTQLLAEREQQSESFEVADGRITWVNQANQTAWINLGEADSLRRQVTFSVFESSETDAGKSEKKGSIEVTRILGEHMAEARITSDDPRNPILPGDNIYTPLWHRGRKIHFALTGIVDLDGDGIADMQQAKDLIALSGGVVDASVSEQGEVEGEMSIETRYLVLGDHPDQPSQTAERDAWEKMSTQADNLGVETITLNDFINQMGYQSLDRTVRMGEGARGADFPPPSADGLYRFRPRTPYSPPPQPAGPQEN